MSRFTDTKYLRWASLFMMCATFLDEIRSRPVYIERCTTETGHGREIMQGDRSVFSADSDCCTTDAEGAR